MKKSLPSVILTLARLKEGKIEIQKPSNHTRKHWIIMLDYLMLNRSVLHGNNNQLDLASKDLQLVIENNPENYQARASLANIKQLMGNTEK